MEQNMHFKKFYWKVHPHSTVFKLWKDIHSCLPPKSIPPATHFLFSFSEVIGVQFLVYLFRDSLCIYAQSCTCHLFFLYMNGSVLYSLSCTLLFAPNDVCWRSSTSLPKWYPGSLSTFIPFVYLWVCCMSMPRFQDLDSCYLDGF